MAERKRRNSYKENDRKMRLTETIEYIHEPTDLQCGQAVLAMITGTDTDTVCRTLGNDRETSFREMRSYLSGYGIKIGDSRKEAKSASDLPKICILSLETPRCWHWSLYAYGKFYDPEHGVMTDFPDCARKYYWELADEREMR